MRIAVLGAGAWGTALALVAADAGHDVMLWSRDADVIASIVDHGINDRYLPGVALPSSVEPVADMAMAFGADLTIVSVPTQFIRPTLAPYTGAFGNTILVDVSKGIERGTHLRVSEVLDDMGVQAAGYVVLSGPSHAEEVGRRLPTTVVVASTDGRCAETVQAALTTEHFRIYTSDDVTGVEVCGALKNVIAIAAGMVDGLGHADNTKAALITRGLAEISRLGVALGARTETFSGLAGLGDLFVTCTSRHSRNRFVGQALAEGRRLDDILSAMSAVAEGVPTTVGALELAASVGVELPITEKVAAILFDGADPRDAIRELMQRPMRPETA